MGRRYAVADLHGRYDLWLGILDYIQPDDKIYFLGDACDRGSAGWKMIKEIYNHPQFVYLKGNHEDILVHALLEYWDQGPVDGYWYRMCMHNGGYQTFEDAISDPDSKEWITRIAHLPLEVEVDTVEGKVYMCHSGARYGTNKDKLWNREHFAYPVATDEAYIIHGHTPTPYVIKEIWSEDYDKWLYKEFGVVAYGTDETGTAHKIDIDVGAVWNGFTVLIDLDTFEIIKITTPESIEYVRC